MARAQNRRTAEGDAQRTDRRAPQLLQVAGTRQNVLALLPADAGRRLAGQVGQTEAPEVEGRDVEAPIEEGTHRDVADVVEAPRGEQPVDDDQRRPGHALVKADAGGDVLAVRALEDVIRELSGICVSQVGRLAL